MILINLKKEQGVAYCCKCEEVLPIERFGSLKQKHSWNKKAKSWCRECDKKRRNELGTGKKWREENKELVNLKQKERYHSSLDVERKRSRENARKNKDKINAKKRADYAANPDFYREIRKKRSGYQREYFKRRMKEDPQFRLGILLRKRIRNALQAKDLKRVGSAVRDLGCSMEFFKSYIEAKFQPGMTWGNWGFEGWHLDHIRPLASFDLEDRDQFLKAAHYTNFQPLWAKDNLAKHDSWTP